MSQFIDNKITDRGLQVLLNAQIGETDLKFTKMVLGEGDMRPDETFEKMTDIIAPIVTLNNLILRVENDNAIITGEFIKDSMEVTLDSNGEAYESFYYKELGLYIKNPEEGKPDILYSYGNAGDLAEKIIIGDGTVVSRTIDIISK